MTGQDTMPRCMYCRCQEERNGLAQLLEENGHRQGEAGSHVLRDQEDRYSVTGLAAGELAMVMWVRHSGRWQCYHPEVFHDQKLVMEPEDTRRFRQNWTVDDETMRAAGWGWREARTTTPARRMSSPCWALTPRARMPDVITCSTARPWRETSTRPWPVGQETLDDLDFAAAARLLREVPELLGECRCQSEAEWVLGVGLRPHEVILVTGQEGDRLTRGDLITAGSLMMDNAMAGQDDRLLEEEGREALRSSTWMHRGALPKREELEMEGARLSEAAREMMSPIAELREAAGDGDAERRYRTERLRVMLQHGLAPEGAERVLEQVLEEKVE